MTVAGTAEIVTIRKALSSRLWQFTIAFSLGVLIVIYWRTFGWWWGKWMEDESYYSHAILIPLMSAFVVYMNRRSLAKIELSPSLWGAVLMLPAVFVELVGHISNSGGVMGWTFPIALIGASIVLFGRKMTRGLLFPLLFLYFMCVLPGSILTDLSFKIQLLSTTIATHLLNIGQLDATQIGTKIDLPGIDVVVGAPCSGFRMLISLMAFAVFFAYMKQGPTWGRLTLVFSTIPLSLLANSIRVTLIAIVGEFWGEAAMHSFHDYSGFIVLIVAFVVLWWLAKVVKCEKFKAMLLS